MSTLEVNAIKSRTGTDITIESGASITGTASQFKITGGTTGQAIITDGSGGLSFGEAGSSTTISDTPPSSPSAGEMWWESDTGRLKIYYNDGSSSQWVDAYPTSAATSDPAMGGDLTGTASNAQIAAGDVGS